MELLLFIVLATLLAIAAPVRGVDSRDTLRPAEITGSHAPLTA
ncbi:MAG TPA: hypothetical protein VFV20_02825 [Candidatus Limnocylindria bacterium]|nr:hypothetical protein [Candidatus Limnocylindria bacterium]